MKIFPASFKQKMQALLKGEADAFFESQENPPPISLRTHPLKNHGNNFSDA